MTFEIYLNSQWKTVRIEKAPQLIKAHDTTNDAFSCVLRANTEEAPIKPMTPFRVTYDDQTQQVFWIINDSVSVFTIKPKTYRHSLSIVQYRYFLNKHLVRTSVFTQPRKPKQKLYLASSVMYESYIDSKWEYKAFTDQSTSSIKIWSDTVKMDKHSKVKVSSINVKIFGQRCDRSVMNYALLEFNKLSDIAALNAQFKDDVEIWLVDKNYESVPLYTFSPLDYFNNADVNEDIKSEINDYLITNETAEFELLLKVDGQSSGSGTYVAFDLSFAEAVDPTADPTDSRAYMLYYLTLQVEVELETYNYTMYDVLDTLLAQYRLRHTVGSTKYKRPELFKLPVANTDGLYELLTSTYIPDTMAFTSATWYETLTEIFRFYDAGFKFNEEPRLQIEYYNDYKEERTDLKFSAKSLVHSDRDFNNGKIAYYQNALQTIKIEQLNTRSESLGIPGKTDYAIVVPKPIYDVNKLTFKLKGNYSIFQSSTVMDIDLDLTPFVVNKEIWSTLDKANNLLLPNGGQRLIQQATLPFERGSNSISVSSYARSNLQIERRVLDNVILLAWLRFLGIPNEQGQVDETHMNPNWHQQHFTIEYTSEISGRAELQTITNKYSGEELVNQGDGNVDLNKLGLNILGESLKNGEPTLTATCQFTDWDTRPKEGQYITYKGSRWIINVVNTSIIKEGVYQSTIEFVRNFNSLSLRVRSDKEKRLTNISREIATISEDNFIDYIYVDDENANITPEAISLGGENIEQMLFYTFRQNDNKVLKRTKMPRVQWTTIFENEQQHMEGLANISLTIEREKLVNYGVEFYIHGTDSDSQDVDVPSIFLRVSSTGTLVQIMAELPNYPDGDDVDIEFWYDSYVDQKTVDVAAVINNNKNLYIPLVKYGFGNSICFEMQYDDPISAGNELIITDGWMGSNQYFSEAKPYTNDYGWKDTLTIRFFSITEWGKSYNIGRYPVLETQVTADLEGGTQALVQTLESVGIINNLHYYKKPNEIFGLNYQWCFLPYNKDSFFIGSKFINENSITNFDKAKTKRFKLCYSSSKKYSILDTKGITDNTSDVSFIIEAISGNKITLKIITPTTISATSSWAIVDENNDIYFASNKAATFTNSSSSSKLITFTTRENRI